MMTHTCGLRLQMNADLDGTTLAKSSYTVISPIQLPLCEPLSPILQPPVQKRPVYVSALSWQLSTSNSTQAPYETKSTSKTNHSFVISIWSFALFMSIACPSSSSQEIAIHVCNEIQLILVWLKGVKKKKKKKNWDTGCRYTVDAVRC